VCHTLMEYVYDGSMCTDPWVFLPGGPGRPYIVHRTGVCEGGKREICVTHS